MIAKVSVLSSLLVLSSCGNNDVKKAGLPQKGGVVPVANKAAESRPANSEKANNGDLNAGAGKFNRNKDPQAYTFSSASPRWVQGRKGIRVYINPDDLETEDGMRPGASIKVTVTEMVTDNNVAGGNSPTVSNGKLLSSGRSCHVACFSDGKSLRLKKGRTVQIAFPRNGTDDMQTFFGKRDESGHINWTTDNPDARFNSVGEPVTTEQERLLQEDSESDAHEMGLRISRSAEPEPMMTGSTI